MTNRDSEKHQGRVRDEDGREKRLMGMGDAGRQAWKKQEAERGKGTGMGEREGTGRSES